MIQNVPSMAPRPRAPGAHSIIRPYKVFASKRSIVPVRPSLDQLPVDLGTPVATAVMCTERIAERARGRREEGRRKRSRLAFGEERNARLKLEGEFGQGGDGTVFGLLARVPVVVLAVICSGAVGFAAVGLIFGNRNFCALSDAGVGCESPSWVMAGREEPWLCRKRRTVAEQCLLELVGDGGLFWER